MKQNVLYKFYKSPFAKGLLFLIVSFISWNYIGLFFIINLILILHFLDNSKNLSFYNYVYKCFIYIFLWNLGANSWFLDMTYGVYGLIVSIFVYLIPFIIFYTIRKYRDKIWIFIFIFFLFELANNLVTSSNPLLTLGNLMGNQVIFIQWYKFTTSLGGSIWILALSYLLFEAIKRRRKSYYVKAILVFSIPAIFSLTIYNKNVNSPKRNILIFNKAKYRGDKNDISISKYLLEKLTKRLDTLDYEYLLIPELTFKYNINNIDNSFSFKTVNKIFNETKISNIILGCEIKLKGNRAINSLLILNKNDKKFTIKKKLVPFTESLPSFWGKIINKIKFVTAFKDNKKEIINQLNILPLICYEGYYPNFEIFNKTRNVPIFLISSEEFLGNSILGKKQLLNFTKIRAIENNAILVRASSNGYSCVINSNGDIMDINENDIIFNFKY